MNLDNYEIFNISEISTPALAVYPSIIKLNIKKAIDIVGGNILRPHIKTCKTPQVVQLMMDAGVTHFKCATIAEAELLGMQKVKDVLLAYQPVGVNMLRLKNIMAAYPETSFSCLIDNNNAVKKMAAFFYGMEINVFIDVNTGMDRTGVSVNNARALIESCFGHRNVVVKGIHAYDGNINDTDINVRSQLADEVYHKAVKVKIIAEVVFGRELDLVIGGTPTFPIHAQRKNVQCSPGTFVFWDKGYTEFADLPFTVAAVLLTRVVSIVNGSLLCLDIGHKAVASENALPQRLHFLNIEDVVLVSHSEEHLVVRVADTNRHSIGDTWYAIPHHICPTVALYNEVEVIENGYRTMQWNVLARNRKINF